jgi:hypothetical protein
MYTDDLISNTIKRNTEIEEYKKLPMDKNKIALIKDRFNLSHGKGKKKRKKSKK